MDYIVIQFGISKQTLDNLAKKHTDNLMLSSDNWMDDIDHNNAYVINCLMEKLLK